MESGDQMPHQCQAEDTEFGPSTYAQWAGLVVEATHGPALPGRRQAREAGT